MKTRVGMAAVLCAALLFQTATVFALDGGVNHIEDTTDNLEEGQDTGENREILRSLDGQYLYTVKDDTAMIFRYDGSDENLVIVDEIDGYIVTEIGESAFQSRSSLQTIELPDSVTKIGDGAFFGCRSLQTIEIPEGVTEIGNTAFGDCTSLQTMKIPEGVTEIRGGTFWNCSSLQTIEISGGVTEIEDRAFESCSSLQTIEIPEGVTEIGKNVFAGCNSLSTISVSKANEHYAQIDGVLFEKSDKKLIEYPLGKNDIAYSIPDRILEIGEQAFADCDSLQTVEIPNSVTEIGASAFINCDGIQTIVIPESVTKIGDGIFEGCSNLQTIELPEGITEIGENAFANCTSLQTIEMPNNVTKIGQFAFILCENLQTIEIPDSVTEIEEGAFGTYTELVVSRNSYAEQWAQENGINYTYADTEDSWVQDDFSGSEEGIYLEPTFLNNTDIHIQEIYMSPQSSAEWGDCLAQGIETYCSSAPVALYVDLSDALYDIKVVDVFGEEHFGTIDFSNVAVGAIGSTEFGGTNVIEINIEDDGSLDCYIF